MKRVTQFPRNLTIISAASLAIGLAVVAPPPLRAAAEVGECPDGSVEITGPGNSNPLWTDNNVSIYAGGDFLVRKNAAEVEGLIVVEGDADIAKESGGLFNIGWVGVGAGIAPSAGDAMLSVGGDLSLGDGTRIEVGAWAVDESGAARGGNVDVGKMTSPNYALDQSRYILNGGTLTQNMGASATTPYSEIRSGLTAWASAYAALSSTGTLHPSPIPNMTEFRSDGEDTQQVFNVTADELDQDIDFRDVPDGKLVIVNVIDSGDVTWSPKGIFENGENAGVMTGTTFAKVAQRTVWNFPNADSVHILGASQVLGSVLVPSDKTTEEYALEFTASINGRVYSNGTILMDGTGNEVHNYPLIEGPLDCEVKPIDPKPAGLITIEKKMSPEDSRRLPAGIRFSGTVVCTAPDGSQQIAKGYVEIGKTVLLSGLTPGSTCQVTEELPTGDGLIWNDPVWEPADTATVPVGGSSHLAMAVTNSLVGDAAEQGAFTIKKLFEAGASGFDGQFTITYQCDAEDIAGSVSLAAGEESEPINAPVGATCTVSEPEFPDAPDPWSFDDPVIEPSSITITHESADEPILVQVTNSIGNATGGGQLGSFVIQKEVIGSGGNTAHTFTGSVSCKLDGETTSYEWKLTDGQQTEPMKAEIGAECIVTEDTPAGWAQPQITPELFIVTAESAVEVRVVNQKLQAIQLPKTGDSFQ